jgi:DNA-directed RNA polymerase subunit RPC12/RpoP
MPDDKGNAKNTACPTCGTQLAVAASVVVPPNCPVHKTPCAYDSIAMAWKCQAAGCGRYICPNCWTKNGSTWVMTKQTDGRYRCPQCGYTTSLPM